MKISKLQIILVFLALVFIGSLFIFPKVVSHDDEVSDNETVACTEEVKVCPDGTMVGRVAPNCDFAACLVDIGGQRDENGCLVSAGYVFEESIGACARYWEVKAEDKNQAPAVVDLLAKISQKILGKK